MKAEHKTIEAWQLDGVLCNVESPWGNYFHRVCSLLNIAKSRPARYDAIHDHMTYFSVYYYTNCVLLKACCATLKTNMRNIKFVG